MYFDAAINHGPYYAKKYYKESNGNFDEFMELRKKHYKRMAEKMSGYQCFHCLEFAVSWDSDFSFEDMMIEGEGIVHMCHCNNCGALLRTN